MKKFMVITSGEKDGQDAAFFDSQSEASEYKFLVEGAMGLEAEVYEYKEGNEEECGGYEFLYA